MSFFYFAALQCTCSVVVRKKKTEYCAVMLLCWTAINKHRNKMPYEFICNALLFFKVIFIYNCLFVVNEVAGGTGTTMVEMLIRAHLTWLIDTRPMLSEIARELAKSQG